MSYLFFESILTELGHKLAYDAVVNYAGNSFAKDSWDMIQDANPMMINDDGKKHVSAKQKQSMADFFGSARIASPEDLKKMNVAKGDKGK